MLVPVSEPGSKAGISDEKTREIHYSEVIDDLMNRPPIDGKVAPFATFCEGGSGELGQLCSLDAKFSSPGSDRKPGFPESAEVHNIQMGGGIPRTLHSVGASGARPNG
jgi:hypothetical protein